MSRARHTRVGWALATLATLATLAPCTTRAAVRVEQDEVVFTLRSPGARDVYLIGDFNRWNPTVERMNANGDQFEVRLFLVAGEYRYKFVVDGTTIVDPDNPGVPDKGSPLRLVERSGGMLLETDVLDARAPAKSVRGWLRYIGALRIDDGDAETTQRVDTGLKASYDRLSARGRVATEDSSWTWSPAKIDAFFDRGRVDVDLGRVVVRGLENDSAWASSDPMSLVGNEGVYGYDAGFRRHGVAALARASHATLRALYADATTRAPRPPVTIAGSVFAGFANGSAPDTAVYAYAYSFDDADVLALDAAASLGDFDVGIAHREDRGLNPGVRASVARVSSGFTTTLLATREDRRVTDAWLRANKVLGASITGSFGWGDAKANAFAQESFTDSVLPTIEMSANASPVDVTEPIMDTWRGVLEVAAEKGRAQMRLRWEGTRFQFDGVEGESRADVDRFCVEGRVPWRAWTLGANLTYTDARYGDTPDALAIDWPEKNPWLSQWDRMDAPSIVGVGLESYDVATLTAEKDSGSTTAGGTLVIQTRGIAGDLRHASARGWVAWSFLRGAYARADARLAWYHDGTRAAATTWAGYLEAGYAWKRVSLNLGFGFDPIVFDPVIGDYADIGRTEFLRESIAAGVRRSDAGALLDRLRDREVALEDIGTIKLECVIELK